MSIAVMTLLALVAAVVLSMVSRLNVGLLAIALAWIIGVYAAGAKPDAVMAGFPVDLFLTLAGVCFLFAVAELNGTFAMLAQRVMGTAALGRAAIPLSFFASAMAISAVGPGAIASVALTVPMAAVIGRRAGIPPMLTALMVANGANAGNLSPISSVGVIANSRMAAAGLGGHEAQVMLANLLAHLLVALLAWLWFLPRLRGAGGAGTAQAGEAPAERLPLTRAHAVTLAVLAAWIAAVVLLKANLALSAFTAGIALVLLRVGEEKAAIARMPWDILLMVCGVATLVALVQESGGTELFSTLVARIAGPETVYGVIAFVTGVISSYSSTSGVVLPAFLPMVPNLAAATGADSPLALALSINVGSALVDVSPLSTLGALCVAALGKDDPRLYFKLFAWGVAMTAVGAALCQAAALLLS